ncbi:uncharacterized protein LOC118370965 isoform X2 [Oncorhynchus keta]|uniref:uncharacterized protein LOC118370965 isoform X2 n=1 Tax=Oncorhynchus keta TaxID=8018 RepID=UPI0015FC9521|nr:uncharacterized protein LOC118370965 isoform X2 [Oncorhynchus keta]
MTTRTLKSVRWLAIIPEDTGVLMDQGRGGDQDHHDPAPEDLEEPDHGHLGEAGPCQHKRIVEGVHSLSFNVQQEVMMRNHMTATLQDKRLNNDIATGHTGDILSSTLITLEKMEYTSRRWLHLLDVPGLDGLSSQD